MLETGLVLVGELQRSMSYTLKVMMVCFSLTCGMLPYCMTGLPIMPVLYWGLGEGNWGGMAF